MSSIELIVRKTGFSLGLLAALGGGILAGIESAIMWPKDKIVTGTTFGVSSCFINSLSYYFVVMRSGSAQEQEENQVYLNTWQSNIFLVVGFTLGATMALSNFNGMYVSYTVLGDRLNELGDTQIHIPETLLDVLGFIFGGASAASGVLFNLTVGKKIWNEIRPLQEQETEYTRVSGDALLLSNLFERDNVSHVDSTNSTTLDPKDAQFPNGEGFSSRSPSSCL
jgi:hypothetical protein